MAMRDDDRAQLTDRHLEHVEVARHGMGRKTSVVEHSMTITVALKGDDEPAVLSDQLPRRAEVLPPVANHVLLARHQHVEEVVDHHCDLDAINGHEHETIVRLANLHLTRRTRHAGSCPLPLAREAVA